MKKKDKVVKGEIRINYGNGSGHPAFMAEDLKDSVKCINLTHSPKRRNTVKLMTNPNKEDKQSTYASLEPCEERKRRIGPILKGWGFTNKHDIETLDKIAVNDIKVKKKEKKQP